MSKIDLNNVAGGFNLSKINDNFQKIETALNDGALWRDSPPGEPNQMKNDLDMNGKRIYNLPAPIADHEPARFKEIKDVRIEIDQAHLDAQRAEDAADRAKYEADRATAVSSDVSNLKVFSIKADADLAAATLPDGQKVSVDVDENQNGRPTQYVVSGATLVFAGYARSMNAGVYIPTPLDFGADPYGIEDSSQAMSDFWAYIKTQLVNLYPTTLPFCKEKFTIPSGVYRIANSVNWTGLRAWNVQIIADGVIFVGEVDNLPIVENLDCRGVHMQGLAILSRADRLPQSGLLIGPKGTATCGNNKFTDVKVLGHFSIAPMHNLGSETTRHDMCYYMNRVGFAAAYDGLNSLGAVSSYVALRSPGVAVSFTNNIHVSCRFENSDTSANAKDAVFVEGVAGWESDKACYFLAFAGAGIQLRDLNGVYRSSNLKIAGLFETSFAPGLKYCMRIVVNDGVSTATSNFLADFQRSHVKTGIIRVETPSGADLTSGAFNFRNSEIRHDDVAYGASKLFDGSRITYIGRINLRTGSIINVKDLLFGYGEIFTDDVSTIPAPTANSQLAFDVYGAGSLSGTGMQNLLGNGSGVGFQGGVHPAVKAVGPNADHDLFLQGKGAGYVRFGVLTTNADTPVTGYITIKDASGTSRKLAVIT